MENTQIKEYNSSIFGGFIMFKHYSPKQKVRTVIDVAFYLIFAYMIISVIINRDFSVSGIAFLIIGVVSLFFGTKNELLKQKYNKALFTLNYACNPDKASKLYDELVEKDIFKIYRDDRALFDVMVELERGNAKKVLEIIEKDDEKFSANVELLLIKFYYQMRANLLLGNGKAINEIYNDVKNIAAMKKRPKIFSYDELEGIHQLGLNNKGRALDCFKKINTIHMNPKEKKFILENLIALSSGQDKIDYQSEYDILLQVIEDEDE